VITDELIKKSLSLIAGSAANHEYFFMKLKTPDWIEPLFKAGKFKEPPAVIQQENTIRFPPWAESQYLVRMAGDAPETVKNVILKVSPTENQRVHQDFVEAALRMPGAIAAEVATKEAAWIREQKYLYVLYPDKVSELIAHLAEHSEIGAALGLAGALTQLSGDARPTRQIGEGEDTIELPKEAVPKFDDWHYQQSLLTITKPLVKADEERGFDLLCDVLEFAIKVHSLREENQEDYSWIWRPQIELENHGDPKDSLVSAVRDAALLIATSNPKRIPALLNRLIARRWRVFRRIATHVLRATPNVERAVVKEFLMVPLQLRDYPQTEPELADFLKRSLSELPEEIQLQVLAQIDAGPSLDSYKKDFETTNKRAPSQEEIEKIGRQWKLQWLEPIHEALPNNEWRNRYQELVKELGRPAEITRPKGGAFVGPTSPKTIQELQQLGPEELTEYLRTWVPSNEWASPTPAGLARQLTSLVSMKPEKFSPMIDKFVGLDRTYVSSVIEGFAEAVKSGRVIDWARVLELCVWVVTQDCEIREPKRDLFQGDPDWIASRIAVARLLREGFVIRADSQPQKDFRKTIWELLTNLATGPDPTADRKQKYSNESMAGSISLNTPRGIALDAAIDYGFWIHPYDQKRSEAGEGAFSEAPELRQLLETVLSSDYSLAIGEVLGRRFPALFMLDRSWAKVNIDLIFRPNAKRSERVAWVNYILFCQPYDDLLPTLTSQYERAIDSLGAALESSVKSEYGRNLVAHLVAFFWRGRLDWVDRKGLLTRFFQKAPVELRAYFFEYIGRSLRNSPLKEGDYYNLLERLRRFLADRISATKQSGKEESELEPFGWWFIANQFESDWRMENLLSVLRLSHKISPDWLVVESLTKEAKSKSLQAVEALEQIVVGDKDGWAIHGWEQHARELLKTALQSENAAARESANRLINIMGSRGQYGFRDLLRKDAPV
jgi:hypothetical protein